MNFWRDAFMGATTASARKLFSSAKVSGRDRLDDSAARQQHPRKPPPQLRTSGPQRLPTPGQGAEHPAEPSQTPSRTHWSRQETAPSRRFQLVLCVIAAPDRHTWQRLAAAGSAPSDHQGANPTNQVQRSGTGPAFAVFWGGFASFALKMILA